MFGLQQFNYEMPTCGIWWEEYYPASESLRFLNL